MDIVAKDFGGIAEPDGVLALARVPDGATLSR